MQESEITIEVFNDFKDIINGLRLKLGNDYSCKKVFMMLNKNLVNKE